MLVITLCAECCHAPGHVISCGNDQVVSNDLDSLNVAKCFLVSFLNYLACEGDSEGHSKEAFSAPWRAEGAVVV